MTELICKNCGKTIQVPEELERFSCVYCGEKLSRMEYLAPSGESKEADLTFAMDNLLRSIRYNPNYGLKNFTKKKYEQSFTDYKVECREVYEAMDRYVLANPDRRRELLDAFTDRFMADWAELHSGKNGAKNAVSDKITLALYEVPAILDMDVTVGEDYVNLLHKKFIAAYPKNVFQPGTYEEISSGFRKSKLCFITTAICELEGKPDDCAELQAFRGFRDGWLMQHGDGALVERYYEIAPAIVATIDFCDDREARYAVIRKDYLDHCYAALRRGDHAACREGYVRMVRDLEREYGLN